MLQFHSHLNCGNSSVVEHNLAMVGVASSTLVSRSIFLLLFLFSTAFSITIKEALSQQLSERFAGISIFALSIEQPRDVPSDIASYRLENIIITSINGAKGGAKATFSKDGAGLNINFKFEMGAQMQVLFATTDIAKNEAISEANSKILPIEIQNYDQIMLKEIPAGKLAKNNIKAGAPIRQNNILSPKDVLRGDELIVEIRDGGVSVQTTGIATTDANIGDVIEIRMGSARQKAQITAKNKAVIK